MNEPERHGTNSRDRSLLGKEAVPATHFYVILAELTHCHLGPPNPAAACIPLRGFSFGWVWTTRLHSQFKGVLLKMNLQISRCLLPLDLPSSSC